MSTRTMMIVSLLLIIGTTLVGVLLWNQLPDPMASHWNTENEVDGYMSKFWGVFFMPIFTTGLFLLFIAIPVIDPLKANIASFRETSNLFVVLFIGYMDYVYILTLLWNLGYTNINIGQAIMPAMGDFNLSPAFKGGVAMALSNKDVNLFSSKDKSNDVGYATKIFLQQTARLNHDTAGWTMRNTANYEFSSLYFNPLERYRPVEFERDWNVNAGQAPHDEHFITFQSFLENKRTGFVDYQLRSHLKGEEYKGLMNMLNGAYGQLDALALFPRG